MVALLPQKTSDIPAPAVITALGVRSIAKFIELGVVKLLLMSGMVKLVEFEFCILTIASVKSISETFDK